MAEIRDLAPHPSKSKTYNELWTFVFQFDQGPSLFLNFTRANLGPKDPVCGTDVVLTGLLGKNHAVAREYPLENFVFDPERKALSVHELIHFDGIGTDTAHVDFETTKRGHHWKIHLKLTESQPGAVWGEGEFKLGDDRVGMFIHVPKAKVKGMIAVDSDSLAVSGTAYMDHTFQTTFVPKLVCRGLRLVQHRGEQEVGQFFESTRDFGHQALGYGLRGEGQSLTLLMPDSLRVLSTKRALKMKVPNRIRLVMHGEPGDKALIFERDKDKAQGSTLEEFSGLVRFGLKKLMGGEVYTFRGQGKLSGKDGVVYSLFEVDD